ncbi:MAG: hypothetical protein ACTSXO_08670 [Candidatus Heimdallarchaeota archaeon]
MSINNKKENKVREKNKQLPIKMGPVCMVAALGFVALLLLAIFI